MKSNVVLIKLKHSFLDVICYVDDEAKEALKRLKPKPDTSGIIEVESPLIMQMMQNPQTQQHQAVPQEMSPFMKDSAKDITMPLRLDDILFGTEANEALTKEYKKMMSGIEEASVSDISMINKNKGS